MERKWLVTVAAGQLDEVTERLRDLGCRVTPEAAVPMEDDDAVVPVTGPEGREAALGKVPGVKAIHPDSELTLFRFEE
jgi:hypothetical protein